MNHPDTDFASTDQAPAEAAAAVDDRGDPGPIPEFLLVQNRKPPTAEEQARIDRAFAKVRDHQDRSADLREQQKAAAKVQAKIKRTATAEKAADVLAAAPLTGKAAIAAIQAKDEPTAALAEHAVAIRELGKKTVEQVIEIGRRLDECQRLLGHGKFGAWLKTEFGWSERTAQRFMSLHDLAESRSDNLSDLNLPISALYLLSAPSTPEKARDEVFERAEAGEPMGVAEVKAAIAESKPPVTGEMKEATGTQKEATGNVFETTAPPRRRRRKKPTSPPPYDAAAWAKARTPEEISATLEALGHKRLHEAWPPDWRTTPVPAHRDGIHGSDLAVTLTKLMRAALSALETARSDKEGGAITALRKIGAKLKAAGRSICDFQVTIKGQGAARVTKRAA
jgi:DUF3102 family protein